MPVLYGKFHNNEAHYNEVELYNVCISYSHATVLFISCSMSLFQKGELLPIPSLDYSNEEELTDDTKLLYEKFDKKMDQCEYLAWICNNMVVAQRVIIHYKCIRAL